jgi:hypothetical protein
VHVEVEPLVGFRIIRHIYIYILDFGLGKHLKDEVDWPLDLLNITQL